MVYFSKALPVPSIMFLASFRRSFAKVNLEEYNRGTGNFTIISSVEISLNFLLPC
jgi:hypothetical protein